MARRDKAANQGQIAGGVAKSPGANAEEDAGRYSRAPRHQRRWGLLVEDELKTDAAFLVQDAFRGGLASLFYLLTSLFMDVQVEGRQHVSRHHPTLIVSNHKRDLDSMILASVCYLARGVTRPNRNLAYAIREDILWPNFLAEYGNLPPLLKATVGRLKLGPIITLLKGYPIGYLTSRRDLMRVRQQLTVFVNLLERGRDVYWTPEGGLSLDGSFGRFRAGLHRLVSDCRAPLHIRPAAIFYDFTTSGRTRCFIRFGPELTPDQSWDRANTENRIRRAVLDQMTVNAGHLLAKALGQLPAHFTDDQLRLQLRQSQAAYQSKGHAIDPRLTSAATFEHRIRELTSYAEQKGILRADTDGWQVERGLSHPDMRYELHELAEIDPAVIINP